MCNKDNCPIPYGFCHCGCGEKTGIATMTRTARGVVKGEPLGYLVGHRSDHGGRPLSAYYEVDASTGCWNWTGGMAFGGYGSFRSRLTGKRQNAHRAVYEEVHGQLSADLHLDHLCRNRACVNPNHMEPVSRTENMRRAINTKLTPSDVGKIKSLLPDLSNRALAAQFGVSDHAISNIRSGRTWKDIEPTH